MSFGRRPNRRVVWPCRYRGGRPTVAIVRLAAVAARAAATLALALGLAATTHADGPLPRSEAARLRIASWNVEWFMLPATFDRLAASCENGDRGRDRRSGKRPPAAQRSIPCDLVPAGRWSEPDLDRLSAYARGLNADVIALQEVDGPDAARRLLPGFGFCFTRRTHVQNVGFAIRPGIPFRCNAELRELGLDGDALRRGADVTLYPGTRSELRLLGVHLKAGCIRDPLDVDDDACRQLAMQVPILESWIDARARNGRPFVVVGDLNRLIARERGPARDARGRTRALWPELDDADPPEADLGYASEGLRARGCTPRDRHRDFIDHIVLSRTAARAAVSGSFRQHRYPEATASRRVPDHCAISVDLAWPPALR